ncbi:Trans-enoyl reductase fsr4 [Hyphodiscus hymeniophilus]|uniref:Trans-enoyl reductase fsr4 n=1 Tax=Hyphodiscus hymeniophilus TaxID=353542 RepID=A0A9P6VF16_9HELO|nr:Trans-enoyl reductase fsr4 [Hyphodiscus hymeniophilus]
MITTIHSNPFMREAIVQADLSVQIVDSAVPIPVADQVLIKVVVSGCNPKDWKGPAKMRIKPANTGDDIAGVVHAVGKDVYEFKSGDCVAAFHEMNTPGGSYAEYAIAPQYTTFHLPSKTSFEEAATIPLAAMTAALGLYRRLNLPEPWSLVKPGIQPLLVYGAATAVGAFTIQLATLSGFHPIIGVASVSRTFVESLIDNSKGDSIVDYRSGHEGVVDEIKRSLKSAGCEDVPIRYAIDAISEHGSPEIINAVLDPEKGRATYLRALPYEKYFTKDGFSYPKQYTMVGGVHSDEKEFAYVWSRYFSRLLAEDLRDGKAHGASTSLRLAILRSPLSG